MGWEWGRDGNRSKVWNWRDGDGRDRRMLASNHLGEAAMLRVRAVVLAAALILAPFGARAADLVVWWEQGFNPEEDAAVREIVAAFEQATGKQVELDLPSHNDMLAKIVAAVEAGQPPDFLYGNQTDWYYGQWADEDRLIDLSEVIRPFASLFDPDGLGYATLVDATTGRRALYALPIGFSTDHVHVWRGLLEQAGFTLADIPKQWEAFWSFWCDRVQPAIRKARGRDDIYGVALAMSADAPGDTREQIQQFMQAYEANYVTREGKLVIDDPEIRRRLIRAMDSYTAIYRKGCTPPDAVGWDDFGNNQAFLAQTVAMTVNDDALDPERAQGRAARGLLQEHGDDRMAGGRRRPAARDPNQLLRGGSLQGRRACSSGQGVRRLSGGRGLARALSRLLR